MSELSHNSDTDLHRMIGAMQSDIQYIRAALPELHKDVASLKAFRVKAIATITTVLTLGGIFGWRSVNG